MSNKMSFLVAGVQRGGNLSIHHCLMQHPMIQVKPLNHCGFFANDTHFENGTPAPNDHITPPYGQQDNIILGEISNQYLHHDASISRIFFHNPQIKIITTLRNPAERAYSHWQQATNQGVEKRSFIDAISIEADALNHSYNDQSTQSTSSLTSYLKKSRYSDQIHHLLQYFDPHQLFFLKSEDLRDDTEVMLYQLFQFLNIPYIKVDTTAQNIGNYERSMTDKEYNFVLELCRNDIQETEAHLGWNCNDWLQQANSTQRSLATT